MKVILLSGPLAVGKTSVCDALIQTYGYERIRSSPYLVEIARNQDLPSDRTGLQNLGDRLDTETDYRWVVDSVAMPLFRKKPEQSLWLFDSVRKRRQIEHFLATVGRMACFHVHLTADEAAIRNRYQSRGGDLANYESEVSHDNERAARALEADCDLLVDISSRSCVEASEEIHQTLIRRDN